MIRNLLIETFFNICFCFLFIRESFYNFHFWWRSSVWKWDSLDREEAAKIIMTREVSFKWVPQIVDEEIKSNVVDLNEVRKRRQK